jgi:phenylalanyl-tRNA synthetase beta chain
VERDLAVVMPEATLAATVEAHVAAHAGALLRDVRLFDIYRGAPLAGDRKSLAFRLRFGAPDRTLTEAEVEAAVATVVAALPAIDAHLRA